MGVVLSIESMSRFALLPRLSERLSMAQWLAWLNEERTQFWGFHRLVVLYSSKDS